MFQSLCEKYPQDKDLPLRAWTLARYRQVLDGTIYDCLRHPFAMERTDSNEYIPIHKRRPSVRYNLCNVVVVDSVSLLFGEGRFPTLTCTEEDARLALAALVKETCLNGVMEDAAIRGSVGSIVVRMRVLDGRVFFDAMDTEFLTPKWKVAKPDTLESVTERYKVRGADLVEFGYAVATDKRDTKFWFQRVWTDQAEEWYLPLEVGETEGDNKTPKKPTLDADRTVTHSFGFVPLVWIRNLPGGAAPDGACTFAPAVNTQIEIEYQLSQGGRGLRYSSDPTLLIKEPAGEGGTMVRGGDNAIVVDADGDAKMLEIGGTAVNAVIDYVKVLRELALEAAHGNRSTPDKAAAAQSGRALELLHEPLIWLADSLRTSYGAGLLALVWMAVRAAEKIPFAVASKPFKVPLDTVIELRWGEWFHPTPHDKLEQAQELQISAQAGHISRETAVQLKCKTNDTPDAPAEMARIMADEAAADARAIALAKATELQIKETASLPN
jgi:hypothetical protein